MLTLVFTDMEDSSVWWRDLDSEFLPVLKRHDALILSVASGCDGTPLETTGDGFFLIFDKPENAVRFSEQTLRALQAENWSAIHPKVEKLRVRIGIHSGSPSAYSSLDGKQEYRGHVVNKAARVMDTAHGGTAVLSGEAHDHLYSVCPETQALVSRFQDWNEHVLKGVGKTHLWQPIWERLDWDFGRIPREKQPPTTRQSVRVPNSNFTGRNAELLALRQQFRSGTPMARKQVIVGLGGIGKTELALAYCERRYAEYDAVFWVKADDETAIESGFLDIARKLELPIAEGSASDETLREVQNWLANEANYLLVLDDVEQFADVEAMLPRGARGHLLLTTRIYNTGDWDTDTPVVLEPLSLAESTAFLIARSGRSAADPQTHAAAELLATELGCLPLALEQAGAYLETHGRTEIEEYHQDFLKRKLEIFRDHPRATTTEQKHFETVTITWNKSFEMAKKYQGVEALFLNTSLLSPDPIPFAFAENRTLPKPMQPLEALFTYSLIWADPATKMYRMHRLVQELGRSMIAQKAHPDSVVYNVMKKLDTLLPAPNHQNWQKYNTYLGHLRSISEQCAQHQPRGTEVWSLLFKTAVYLQESARLAALDESMAEAIEHQMQTANASLFDKQKIAEILELALWAARPTSETALRMNELVYQYSKEGNYTAALPLCERALKICEKVLGAEHPDTATSLNNLAFLYWKTGNYVGALPLCEGSLKIRENVLGAEHPDTANSLNNLAGLYRTTGNYAAAVPLSERALKIQEKVLGAEHPDTANSLNNLAALYKSTGNYADAPPLYKRALKIQEKVLGAEHPDTASSLNNLAALYESIGDYAAALPLYERALKVREKVLGAEHPDTAMSLNNLANLYRNTGDYAAALPLFERALKVCEKVLGAEHPDTAMSLNSLAFLYWKTGNYVAALPLYEYALKICEEVLGIEHPTTKIVAGNNSSCRKQIENA